MKWVGHVITKFMTTSTRCGEHYRGKKLKKLLALFDMETASNISEEDIVANLLSTLFVTGDVFHNAELTSLSRVG